MEKYDTNDTFEQLIHVISLGASSLVRQLNRRRFASKLSHIQIYISIILGISNYKLIWSKNPDLIVFALVSYIAFFVKLWIYDDYVETHSCMEESITIINTNLGMCASNLDRGDLNTSMDNMVKYRKDCTSRLTMVYIFLGIMIIANTFLYESDMEMSVFLILTIICDIYHITTIKILNSMTDDFINDVKNYNNEIEDFLKQYTKNGMNVD